MLPLRSPFSIGNMRARASSSFQFAASCTGRMHSSSSHRRVFQELKIIQNTCQDKLLPRSRPYCTTNTSIPVSQHENRSSLYLVHFFLARHPLKSTPTSSYHNSIPLASFFRLRQSLRFMDAHNRVNGIPGRRPLLAPMSLFGAAFGTRWPGGIRD
ncbi:hypothetical protein B0H15DRAFT_816726 [Mycena belliarum]|uniref:Uncharacterized protein n=1 Tax=Mycena belliarum TaxID=1033014 RepID=A0AAD6XSP6_9AGAR|nr:hypothetical protein B0H15DRAFT_816726 [Mycena belliae]